MSARRFSKHLAASKPAVATKLPFVPVPTAVVVPAAVIAEVYRLAYETALARVIARRRCAARFSLN